MIIITTLKFRDRYLKIKNRHFNMSELRLSHPHHKQNNLIIKMTTETKQTNEQISFREYLNKKVIVEIIGIFGNSFIEGTIKTDTEGNFIIFENRKRKFTYLTHKEKLPFRVVGIDLLK